MPSSEPSRKIRVLVVDDIVETRENVRKLLFFEDDIEIVGMAGDGREGVELAGKLQPDIALMDINMPGMDGIAASEAIAEQYPEVQVIMMSVQGESDYLRRSMLAGAREFLIKPFSGEELATSIRRVRQLAATRRAAAPPPPIAPVMVGAPPPPPPKGGKVIAVFGTKGGCGSSTVAVNLAVALHQETKDRVALVDANLEFGDVGVLLNLPSNRSIADLASPQVEMDEDLISSVMASHSCGIRALLAPPRPEMAELVGVQHLKRIGELLPKMFDYTVMDLARTFQESMVTLLDAADQIVLVATNDIPSIKNAKVFFELTEQLGYPADKIFFLLNKEDGRSGIAVRDIEASVKHAVRGILPRDDRAILANNRGTPIVLVQRLALTQSYMALARALRRPHEKELAGAGAVAAAPAHKIRWFGRK